MRRRLFWFSAGIAAAPLAWGVAHVTYIAVDDWPTERRKPRRDIEHELGETCSRFDDLAEDVALMAKALLNGGYTAGGERFGRDLLTLVERARNPEAIR